MVAPILSPNDREIMKYSPPPSTRLFVASSDRAKAVGIVSECPIIIISKAPQKPRVPTAKPNLKKRIAPSIVEIAVKKTGTDPNRFPVVSDSIDALDVGNIQFIFYVIAKNCFL